MEQREQVGQNDAYRGFGDTLSRAFELVLVPMIFGFAGWGLDRWLGTAPVLMIVLGAIAVVGLFARAWYAYADDMRAHEAKLPLSRREQPAGRV